MFFSRTEERVITRKEIMENQRDSEEYLVSALFENGSYVSGVSTVRRMWCPDDLQWDEMLEPHASQDVISRIVVVETYMSRLRRWVASSKELAVFQKIIEGVITDCASRGDDVFFSKWNIHHDVYRKFNRLYLREFCRLVWSGSIRYVVRRSYFSLEIQSGMKLKEEVLSKFFERYSGNRCWIGVNAAFRIKMLKCPENMPIVRMREYFGAMAALLQSKTVFDSDMHENPIHYMLDPAYDPDKVSARLGTKLVEKLEDFGYFLEQNLCYRAGIVLEQVLGLQAEVCKVTEQSVRELTVEALEVLEENENVLKKYFDAWDTYLKDIFCGDQSVDALE